MSTACYNLCACERLEEIATGARNLYKRSDNITNSLLQSLRACERLEEIATGVDPKTLKFQCSCSNLCALRII